MNIYEKFHEQIQLQNNVISRDNFTYREIINSLLNIFPLLLYKNVLDIGCGSGSLSFFLAKEGFEVFGFDISNSAIKNCKLNSKLLNLETKTHFEVIDFPKKIPNEKFNLIICSEILEHINNDEESLSKIHNLLENKGILVVSVPSSNSLLYKFGFLKKFDKRVGHLRRYSFETLVNKLQNNGFTVLKVKKIEGIIRNSMFSFKFFNIIIKFANKFIFISDVISFIDNLSIPIFGESGLIIVAQNKEGKSLYSQKNIPLYSRLGQEKN